MGVITLTRQEEKYILMNTLEKKEIIQEPLVKLAQTIGFESMVPFEFRSVRGKRVIISDLTGTYSIITRLQNPIDSRELVLILKGLLDSIKSMSTRKIPPHNIDLDLDYVFIRRDGKVLLTLWALEGLAPKRTLPALFKQIGEEAKPKAKKDKNFVDGYLALFDVGFSMEKLDKFVTASYDMLKKSVVEGGTVPEVPRGFVKDEPKQPSQPVSLPIKQPIVVEDDEDDILEPTNKTTFLADFDDEETDGKTTILSEGPSISRFLIRVSTNERYDIRNGESLLGKKADISFDNNTSISRKHAKIIVFDGVVTIEDVGSSNGTKVNGTKIAKGETEQLMSGDIVTLANEDFEYHEEQK